MPELRGWARWNHGSLYDGMTLRPRKKKAFCRAEDGYKKRGIMVAGFEIIERYLPAWFCFHPSSPFCLLITPRYSSNYTIMHLLTPLLLASLAAATPLSTLTKRWTCGGDPPAFACQPKAGCANETAWGECAYAEGLDKCGDPLPNQTTPVSACQSAAFTTCGEYLTTGTRGDGESEGEC